MVSRISLAHANANMEFLDETRGKAERRSQHVPFLVSTMLFSAHTSFPKKHPPRRVQMTLPPSPTLLSCTKFRSPPLLKISLPMGFSSCWKECAAALKARNREVRQPKIVVVLPKLGTSRDGIAGTANAAKKVVPVEEPTV